AARQVADPGARRRVVDGDTELLEVLAAQRLLGLRGAGYESIGQRRASLGCLPSPLEAEQRDVAPAAKADLARVDVAVHDRRNRTVGLAEADQQIRDDIDERRIIEGTVTLVATLEGPSLESVHD